MTATSSGSSFSKLRVDHPAPGVRRLVFDRPEARNALDLELLRAFAEAVQIASTDEAVRAVLLAGSGASFSVGGDVKLMDQAGQERRPQLLRELVRHFHTAVLGIASMPKPVVAAVRGGAGGGGLSIMLACDLAVVDEAGKFAVGFNLIGLSPDGGLTYHLPRRVGLQRAAELCFLNPIFDGRRAVELGLANRAVPAERVDEEALALAAQLASGPTRAFARTKELLRAERGLSETLVAERQSISELSGEPDATEGLQAFVSKRPPRFRDH
ncbi:MAG TPA: enoyl-CoA hydratase-related protein [Polyangia bacterium]|jgi:2-(1,2-epoxy-1,2-dihydrophenyl)acetyl-CoA isomerase|nr:enoyl-CoA hydratase-related protein [Polyangia bacterium]